MAYTKQTWATGDVITADKLNHLEDGVATNGLFVVKFSSADGGTTWTADKTVAECIEAYNNGMDIVAIESDQEGDAIYRPNFYYTEEKMTFQHIRLGIDLQANSYLEILTFDIYEIDGNEVVEHIARTFYGASRS